MSNSIIYCEQRFAVPFYQRLMGLPLSSMLNEIASEIESRAEAGLELDPHEVAEWIRSQADLAIISGEEGEPA